MPTLWLILNYVIMSIKRKSMKEVRYEITYFYTDIRNWLFENQVSEILYILDQDPNISVTLFVLNKPSRFFKINRNFKRSDPG